jgi:hypothetical protein
MVWYVAFIAILNLGLGYALAVYMERSQRLAAATSDDLLDDDTI